MATIRYKREHDGPALIISCKTALLVRRCVMINMKSLVTILFTACVIGVCLADADDITKCVKDCHNMPDGDYQDCHSCHIYITCSNKQMLVRPCPTHLSWDDKQKKCVEHSSTCKKLADARIKCVTDCHNVSDGNYQDCRSCHIYVSCSNGKLLVRPCPQHLSWDDKQKKCVEHSSTCKKLAAGQVTNEENESDGVELMRRANIPHPRCCNSTGKNCVKNCTGMKDGDYQSCHGCDVYVSCVAGNRYDDRPCAPGGLVWDDKKKRCEWNSTTCKGCYTPDRPCKGTGPRCVRDCSRLPNGDYQSCFGCNMYLSCSGGLKYDRRPCAPGGTVWDDNKKICDWYSNTCFRC